MFSLLYFLSSGEQFGLETFSIEFIQEINALTDSWNVSIVYFQFLQILCTRMDGCSL